MGKIQNGNVTIAYTEHKENWVSVLFVQRISLGYISLDGMEHIQNVIPCLYLFIESICY